MKKILSLILFAALFAGGCSKTPSPGTSSTTTTLQNVNLDDVEFVSALVSFTTCDELLSYLKEQAVARVGPYGLDARGWYGPIGILRMEEGMMIAEPEMALATDSDASMAEECIKPFAFENTNIDFLPKSKGNSMGSVS